MVTIDPSEYTISHAVEADIPRIIDIITTAYLPEPHGRFIYDDWPSPTGSIRQWFTVQIEPRIKNPKHDSETYKITSLETGEIVGALCLLLKGDKPESTSAAYIMDLLRSVKGMNVEVMMDAMGRMARFSDIMRGRRHFVVTTFGVDQRNQGNGLGTKLLEKCIERSEEEGLPVYLQALPGAYSLYVRHNFKVIDYEDIDLNDWGKKLCGYGVYRSFAMVREVESA